MKRGWGWAMVAIGVVLFLAGAGLTVWMLVAGAPDPKLGRLLLAEFVVFALLGMGLIALSQRWAEKPILRLSLLRNASYASVIFIVFVVGAGIYGVSYILPQFLALIAGYNAQQSGAVMLYVGLPAFAMMPILPRLIARVDFQIGRAHV